MATDGERFWTRAVGLLGLDANGRGLRFWEVLSIFGFWIGLLAIGVYAAAGGAFTLVFGVLSVIGTAAWLAGGVLGFLFGVPRLRAVAPSATPASSSLFTPNTNLEQISDWLTKIIVGATLVQLQPLGVSFVALAKSIGAELGTRGAASVSGGVMVLYFCGGFMWGYLWCSLRIFREMSALTDREATVSNREAALSAQAQAGQG